MSAQSKVTNITKAPEQRKVYLRGDMMKIELHVGNRPPLLFDKIDTENKQCTIQRVRHSDDAEEIAWLTGLCNFGAVVTAQPLWVRDRPVGAALVYKGEMTVRTRMTAEENGPAYLTVVLSKCVVSSA